MVKGDIDIGRDYTIEVVIDTVQGGLQEQFRRVYSLEPNYVRYAAVTRDDVEAARQTPEYLALRAEAAAERDAKLAEQETRRVREAQVAAKLAALLRRAKADGEPCYLRYRKPPESGRSYNARDNVFEAGVSVYRAYRLGERFVIDLTGHDLFSSLFISQSNEDPYLVTGEEIGTGADGEPVLRNLRIVRRVPRGCIDLAWE